MLTADGETIVVCPILMPARFAQAPKGDCGDRGLARSPRACSRRKDAGKRSAVCQEGPRALRFG